MTHSPTVWKAIGSLHDFVNGASLLVWTYQHIIGHHHYTNIDDADPDIMTTRPVSFARTGEREQKSCKDSDAY